MRGALAAAAKDARVGGKLFLALLTIILIMCAAFILTADQSSMGEILLMVAVSMTSLVGLVVFPNFSNSSIAEYALPLKRRDLVAGRYLYFPCALVLSAGLTLAFFCAIGHAPSPYALALALSLTIALGGMLLPVFSFCPRNLHVIFFSPLYTLSLLAHILLILFIRRDQAPIAALTLGISLILYVASFFLSVKIIERKAL
jgi:hypothetical protein